MSNKTNYISPRDFNKVSEKRSDLIMNYAIRIRNYTQTNISASRLCDIFFQLFGAYWFEAPFNKLVTAAKLANYGCKDEGKFTKTQQIAIDTKPRVAITEELRECGLARDVLRFFNKKVVDDIISRHKIYTLKPREMEPLLCDFKRALTLAMEVKKYDKKSLKYLKHAKGFNEVDAGYYITRELANLKDEKVKKVLPQELSEKLLREGAEQAAKTVTRVNNNRNDTQSIIASIRNEIGQNAYRITYVENRYQDYYVNKLCKCIREYYVLEDFANKISELKLEARTSTYGWFRRLNRKTYRVVVQTAKANIPLEAKQQTICDMAMQVCRMARYSRVVWTPKITIMEDK